MIIINEVTSDIDISDAIKAYTAKGGELASKFPFTRDKQMLLMKVVEKSNYTGDLYRGMYFSEKQWDSTYEILLNDGSVWDFNLPLISFTKDKHRASSYGKGGQIFVKFHLSGKCTGLDITNDSIYPEEKEVIVSGKNKFKVINSDMPRMGSFVINIKQV